MIPVRFIGFCPFRDYIIAVNEHGDVYRLWLEPSPHWQLVINGPYPFPPEEPR